MDFIDKMKPQVCFSAKTTISFFNFKTVSDLTVVFYLIPILIIFKLNTIKQRISSFSDIQNYFEDGRTSHHSQELWTWRCRKMKEVELEQK